MVRLIVRALTLVLAIAGVVASTAGPALAHGRGSDATNFRSRVVQPPDLPGVTWHVEGGGEFITASNDSDAELVILGYDGQDDLYLRIGPDGVFRNANSTATYLNETRLAQDAGPIPDTAGAGTEPDWVKISDDSTYSWTDHRIHWESPQPPPNLTSATSVQEVFSWNIPVRYDGDPQQVQGVLEWVPGPPPWPMLAVGVGLTLPALLSLRAGRPPGAGDVVTDVPEGPAPDGPTAPDETMTPAQRRWAHRAAAPAAVVLGLVSVANVMQLIDDFFAVPQPFGAAALKGVQTALFILIGLFGAIRAWQARDGAFTALGVGSIAIFVGQGVLYWSVLSTSQTTSIFPAIAGRAVVAASLGQLVSVGIVALWGNSRIAAATPQPAIAKEAAAPGATPPT